jgi:hypothetical protein
MKRWVVTNAVVLLFPVFASAWNEPEGFMIYKWGMSEAQVKEILLNKYSKTFYPGDSISVGEYIGDVHVYILFSFITSQPPDAQESKLGKMTLNFETKDFRSLKAIFLERYGTPTSARSATFTNAFGANLTGDVLEWKGKITTILLNQYGRRLDNGFCVLISKEMQEKEAAEESRKAKEGAKGL